MRNVHKRRLKYRGNSGNVFKTRGKWKGRGEPLADRLDTTCCRGQAKMADLPVEGTTNDDGLPSHTSEQQKSTESSVLRLYAGPGAHSPVRDGTDRPPPAHPAPAAFPSILVPFPCGLGAFQHVHRVRRDADISMMC